MPKKVSAETILHLLINEFPGLIDFSDPPTEINEADLVDAITERLQTWNQLRPKDIPNST